MEIVTEKVGGGCKRVPGDTNRINIDDFLPLEHFIAFAFFFF